MLRQDAGHWAQAAGLALCALVMASPSAATAARVPSVAGPAAPGAPALFNPGFECSVGIAPQAGIPGLVHEGWTGVLLDGRPTIFSGRWWVDWRCDGAGVEKIEGEDDAVFISEDIETPPAPGKPFDAAVYQQVAVTPGTAYSLSGWMLSLCGGSAQPSSCPQGYYIAKMLGIDPTGGINALAPSVVWAEDRHNFSDLDAIGRPLRWINLRLAVTARSDKLTVFGRIRSPYRWHGNHAFVDGFSLVRAPTARLVELPSAVYGTQVTVRWDGAMGPDIAAVPGGTYQLLFDVQYQRKEATAWMDWQVGQPASAAPFQVDGCAGTQAYSFRVRARAEQPEGSHGAWPNQRYPGDWSDPAPVVFLNSGACTPRAYVPLIVLEPGG